MKLYQMIPSQWVHKNLQYLFCIEHTDGVFYRQDDDCGDIVEMKRRVDRKTAIKLYEAI
jgi:hypothetical protein